MQSHDHLQHQVNSMLRRGILFSIFWLMGVGSLISIVQAIKAFRIIRESNGEIKGMGKVLWCFIVGGTGVVLGLRHSDGHNQERDLVSCLAWTPPFRTF